jgi:hypothetical protein
MKPKTKRLSILLLIFLIVFGGYLANIKFDLDRTLKHHSYRRLMTSLDINSNTFLPYVIIKHKTVRFDGVMPAMRELEMRETPYSIVKVGDHYYSSYPILTGLMGVPIYLVPILLNKIPNLDTYLNIIKMPFLGRVTASFYTAISVVLFYLILDKLAKLKKIKDKRWIIIFTFF